MQRKLVVEDVCHLSQVSTQAFLTYALPTFPLDHVASLRAQLSSKGTINTQGHWHEFSEEPKNSNASEKVTFSPLKNIFEAIALLPSHPSPLTCVQDGNITPYASRNNLSRPDGFLKLSQSLWATQFHAWQDIVQAWEFKLSDGPNDRPDVSGTLAHFHHPLPHFLQNRDKIIWSGHHILRNDACRIWTTGLTIENTNARMWYFDCSAVVVSQPFNILEESQ